MELQKRLKSIYVLEKQRNALLLVLCISLLVTLMLALRLVMDDTRTVLVPGLAQEVMVSDGGVSRSYIEEVSSMYLPLLLDLDVGSIDWKRDRIMSHVAVREEGTLKQIGEYFARAKERYNDFGLSTHFALKRMDINAKSLVVIADGQLISRFGNRGYESEYVSYRLVYKWMRGRLLLVDFRRLKEEGDGRVVEKG